MRTKRRKRDASSAAADLTPMIDVVFQLLIFFILCTRFREPQESLDVELPKTDGLEQNTTIPTEALTIYCVWDADTGANSYVLGIEARGRIVVSGGFARIEDVLILSRDTNAVVAAKKAAYKQMHESLVAAIESYIVRSGAGIEKIEISFARDPVVGASSGTAPWLFVSAALDAAAGLNKQRKAQGLPVLPVNFKFSDSLRQYG